MKATLGQANSPQRAPAASVFGGGGLRGGAGRPDGGGAGGEGGEEAGDAGDSAGGEQQAGPAGNVG